MAIVCGMPSAAEIERHFAAGAESITLTRAEWEAFYTHQREYAATGLELRKAQAETERVKRIARPLWGAVAKVRGSMANALERRLGRSEAIPRGSVEAWERMLRYAQELDWKDLPAGHRRHADFKR